MDLYLLIVLPIFASLLLYLIPGKVTTWISSISYFSVLLVTLHLFYRVRFLGQIVTTNSGGGFLGITLYCDLTAAVFLVLVAFLFLCMFLYTNVRERTSKLYSFLFTVLEGLVMLIFLSRDLFNIYVAVEVSAIVCATLIMFKRESRSIYDGMVYLLVNITGMLFFLLGIGMIYRQLGVLDFDGIAAAISSRPPKDFILPFALLMTGTALKCALFPMHFWLPLAHGTPGAPTPISAILSGIYVKSGVYLFMRLQSLFSPVIDCSEFFFWVGVLSSVAGIVMAVCQCDVKLILAYHTVSQIGLIIAGLSFGSETVQAGAMLHIVNHALFKSLLFLAAGMMIAKYGTRNIYEIRGVMRSLPLAGVAIISGVLGITGAPFFNGSISKYFLAQTNTQVASFCFLIINFGTILSFVKFGRVLFGEKQTLSFRYHPLSTMVVLVLSALCLLTGVFAAPLLKFVLNSPLTIGISGYVSKTIIWIFSFIGADLLYRKVLSHSKRLHEGIDFSVSFNTIVFCLGGCFIALLGAAYVSVL